MKRWCPYLIIILLGIVIGGYLMVKLNPPIHFAGIWNIVTQAKKTQSDLARISEVKAVPKEVLELRQRHHLRPLTELEDGNKTRDLPNGIYGFSMCDVASLSAKRGNTSSLEIHKHLDGIVYYVGYASEDHIEKYLARQNNFHILTSPNPQEKASAVFEIPVDFVSKCEARPLGEGYLFDLFVTAIPELHS
jgi:hypothetical protein